MAVQTIIVGAGGRGYEYSKFGLEYPREMEVVGIAEPDDLRRERVVTAPDISPDMSLKAWQSPLQSGDKKARAVINCTMDRLHFESTMQMLEAGYDVLLEKPMTPVLYENIKLVQRAEELGRLLQVCHVLRY